jgi:two-component system, LuxR family, sensor kinase FixL
MLPLDWMWDQRKRAAVLSVSAALILLIAVVDWWTKPYVSLGFLYLFPVILSAGFVSRWAVVVLGLGCAALSDLFSSLDKSLIRPGFEAVAIIGGGLFVAELIRNRRLSLESQQRFRILVETSPAAIVTINENGFIDLANRAAEELLAPRDGKLVAHPIAAFLPELHRAVRREEGPQFRTSMQCRGHRDNGESFMADVWFSTYTEGSSHQLAAIIAEVEDAQPGENGERNVLNTREMDVLRFLVQGLTNKEIAARMEVSESTVKNTFQQLFGKLGVRTRSQLVRVALEQYRDIL